jgi:thioesterase domain-containing protein
LASLLQTDGPEIENWNVVRIQGDGSKIPVIAINNTVAYYNLSRRVGTDRPFIGIQLFDPSKPRRLEPRDLEDIAADYVRLIRRARPQGPYILMGLCVAGAIAYEAAAQLRRDGEDVPLVILSDTWRPGYLRGLPFVRKQLASWHYRLHVARHYLAEVREGNASLTEVLSRYRLVRQSRILNLARALRLIDEVPRNQEDWSNRWFLPHLEAARNRYRPRTGVGDGTLVLYQSDEIVTRLSDKLMGWSEFADRIEVQAVPGWHTSMFQDEGARVIADHLRPLLERVDREHVRQA